MALISIDSIIAIFVLSVTVLLSNRFRNFSFNKMLEFFILSFFIFTVRSEVLDKTTVKTNLSTLDSPGTVYCNYYPHPSDTDEGNYGDAVCQTGETNSNETLLLRDILYSVDGEASSLSGIKTFTGKTITKVTLLNFGRYHGATNYIGILNKNGDGKIQYTIDVFSTEGIRMFLEVFGY